MQVAVEGLLYSSFSLQSRCIHTEDSGKLVVPGLWVLGTWNGLNDQLGSSAIFWRWKFWSWHRHQRGGARPCSSQTRREYSLLHPPWRSLVLQANFTEGSNIAVDQTSSLATSAKRHWARSSESYMVRMFQLAYRLEEIPLDRGKPTRWGWAKLCLDHLS